MEEDRNTTDICGDVIVKVRGFRGRGAGIYRTIAELSVDHAKQPRSASHEKAQTEVERRAQQSKAADGTIECHSH